MRYDSMSDNGLPAYVLTTGVQVPYVLAKGCTLGVATYVFPFGQERSAISTETALLSFHAKWAAAVAGTLTIETCNFPATLSGNGVGAADVADWDSVAGNWIQYNPTLTGALYANVVGTGNSVTAFTVTLGGTNAGGCSLYLPDMGARRVRAKLVASVGGLFRAYPHGKLGA